MPLLTKKGNGHGWVFGKVTVCHAWLAGILFGMALGMFLSMALLSWMPASGDEKQGEESGKGL